LNFEYFRQNERPSRAWASASEEENSQGPPAHQEFPTIPERASPQPAASASQNLPIYNTAAGILCLKMLKNLFLL
jgi:hypothetical protein